MNNLDIRPIEQMIDLSEVKYINNLKKASVRDFFEFDSTSNIELEDGILYTLGKEEYLVLTEEEAEELARKRIEESVWTFNAEFLEEMTNMDAEVFEILQRQCEIANSPIMKLIVATCGFEEFAKEAIRWDGRGHFISWYNGIEELIYDGNNPIYLYRIN